jgi:hypothetical protein
VRDKFAIDQYNRASWINETLAELKAGGYIVWLDCSLLFGTVIADVYLLTPKGVKLCDDNGIRRQ